MDGELDLLLRQKLSGRKGYFSLDKSAVEHNYIRGGGNGAFGALL